SDLYCLCVVLALGCSRSSPSGASGQPSQNPSQTQTASAPSLASSAPSPPKIAPSAEPAFQAEPAELKLAGGVATHSKLGMVTSVEAQATRAGVAVLEAGGNAVDAAVAVGYALAVTHPSAGNIGGGGFMLVRPAGGPTVAIDFREVAPQGLTQADFNAMIEAEGVGPAASGVPGSVAGLNLAQRRFGKLKLAEVLQPAIDLALKGHVIGQREGLTLAWSHRALRDNPEARRVLAPKKKALKPGQRLFRKDLGHTLERIAKQGDAGFYEGKTAEAIVAAMGKTGRISLSDLKAYAAKERKLQAFDYRGLQVEVMPPPSAGGVAVLEMLKMWERLEAYKHPADSVAAAHFFVEIAKRAHADRRFDVVDPDTSERDPVKVRERWLDPMHWLTPHPIDPTKATPAADLHPLYTKAAQELEHTTHFSVADRDGMVVSCTTTLSAGFGAKYVVPGTGIVMNNSAGAFGSVGESTLKGGRRMTSSMTPTLVLRDGKPVLVLGSPGGDTIPNTVFQVLRNVVDYRLPLSVAVERGRLHHGFLPVVVRYERRKPPAPGVLDGLKALGHSISKKTIPIGDANNLMIIDGEYFGVSDSREGGLAAAPTR
ncbi:MAG: gamma-glutamyltransferase, partial [Polyangiaceae bacterium]